MTDTQLAPLVRELLAILETVEETDGGREFHPTTIQTCRCMTGAHLDKIFTRLKDATRTTNVLGGE